MASRPHTPQIRKATRPSPDTWRALALFAFGVIPYVGVRTHTLLAHDSAHIPGLLGLVPFVIVLAVALRWGWRVGTLSAIAFVTFHLVLFNTADDAGAHSPGVRGAYQLMLLTIGAIAGYIADLNRTLRREIVAREAAEHALGAHVEELQEVARRDFLTGLFNRRHFHTLAEHAFQHAREHDEPLPLILLDIDHFKRINDTHGHLAGDDALIAVASFLGDAHSDPRDIVARFGGEEFVIALPGRAAAAAHEHAEALRVRIASLTLPKTPEGRITASLGVAHQRADDVSIDDVINRADRLLYDAKEGGRDQVRWVP